MPRSITPLLADRLDISEERAQSLLQSMLTELRHRAETDGVQLSELGTFREEDGALTFVPSSSLRRRVNHQFEGLSPEDLSAPEDQEAPPTLRDVSDADEPQETASGSTNGAPPEAAEEDDIPTIEPVEEDASPSASSAEESASSPSSDSSEEPDEDSIPTLDPIDTEEESDAPADGPEEAEEKVAPAGDEEEAAGGSDDQSWDPLPIIGGVLGVIALIGVLWLLLGDLPFWSSGQQQASYGDEEPTATQSTESSTSPSEETSTQDTSGQQTSRFAGVPPGDQDTAGTAPTEAGPWTIVVASRSSRAAAEEMAAGFEDSFAAVEIVPGQVNDRTWYRVTLGRYRTEAAAARALKDHASTLPPDAWTHQLQ